MLRPRGLKGPLEAASTRLLAGGKEGGGSGQRKLWAPPAGGDLELLQTIVSSGQAFSAGRGGLEAPLPPALTSGGLASPQLGGAAGVRAEPRDWPLGVGPALSPRLWSRQCSRLSGAELGAELGASASHSVVFWGSLGSWECRRKTQLVQLALGAGHCSVSLTRGD